MRSKLRADWFRRQIDPSVNMDAAGIYQWSIEGVGVYVGKTERRLRRRLSAYPRNVIKMIEGHPWHGNPEKEYRAIHKALREAYDSGTLVTVTVLEICDSAICIERERHWIRVRREEAEQGGPCVLNGRRNDTGRRSALQPGPGFG